MKLVADAHGRLTAAKLFRPGTAFDATPMPDGSIRIVELVEKRSPRARIVRRHGRTLLESERTFTPADVQKALEEFP